MNRCLLNRQTVSIQSLRHCKKHSVGVPAPVHPAEVLETRLRLESSVRFSRLKAIPRVIHAPKAKGRGLEKYPAMLGIICCSADINKCKTEMKHDKSSCIFNGKTKN